MRTVPSVSRLEIARRFAAHRFAALHPYEVQAVLHNACNLRCSYCRCPDMDSAAMSTADWIDIIGRFRLVGTLRIKFQGGEPTTRRDFADICAAVQAHGIVSAVVTNGIALARHPALFDSLDEVVVSLDAVTPVLHDRQRGAGTHALAVRAIDEGLARGCRVFVNMVVTRETVGEVEPMLDFCEARGAGFNAQPAMFSRSYQDAAASHLGLSIEEEQSLERRLAKWKRQRKPLMFSAASYEHAAAWPDYNAPTTLSDGESNCMAGRFYVHIEPNGDVFPCVLQGAAFTPKNILTDGFDAALLNARHHNCGDCFLPYLNERKALFGLRPQAVLAWLARG
jgi:mycofactocin biosynthetic radical S-adenosylmethionine protein MftC